MLMSCVPKDPLKKYEHSSIPYQSNSEIDVINWYGNLMFIWFCPPKVFFAKYKKDIIQMYLFYELLHYQNDSNIKNSAKEMILKVILTCYYFL